MVRLVGVQEPSCRFALVLTAGELAYTYERSVDQVLASKPTL